MHPLHHLAAVRSMVNVRDRVTQEGVQTWWSMNNYGAGREGGNAYLGKGRSYVSSLDST